MTTPDLSNGYDAIAEEFIRGRGTNGDIGVSVVRQWAQELSAGAEVLDLGCGTGFPVSKILFDQGLRIYAVDASPKMIAEFRRRFPNSLSECNSVEASRFFDHTFDAVIAWGLVFLLQPGAQTALIQKVARSLHRGGKFLFTSPQQAVEWPDSLTGQTSVSLGADLYRQVLDAQGLHVLGEGADEGDNYYYLAEKA